MNLLFASFQHTLRIADFFFKNRLKQHCKHSNTFDFDVNCSSFESIRSSNSLFIDHLYDHLVCAAVELCCVIIKGVLFIHLNFINKRSLNNKYSM